MRPARHFTAAYTHTNGDNSTAHHCSLRPHNTQLLIGDVLGLQASHQDWFPPDLRHMLNSTAKSYGGVVYDTSQNNQQRQVDKKYDEKDTGYQRRMVVG